MCHIERHAVASMSSASLGNPFKQLWSAYERQLEKRPIATQMTTSFLLWGSGDLIAQRLEKWEQQKQRERQLLEQQQQKRRKQKAAVPAPPPGTQSTSSIAAADSGYDVHRAFFTAMFGALFVGPIGHVWYQAIDNWCKQLIPKGGPGFIAAKVALDTIVMGPLYVAGQSRQSV